MIMRKATIVFLAVIILLSACFVTAHIVLLDSADDVTLTRHTLFGDPSYADGAEILLRNHYDQNLLWETSLTFGVDEAPNTKFTFSNDYIQLPSRISYKGVTFNSFSDVFAFFDDHLPETTREKYAELIQLFTESESEVSKGEYKTFTVDLADYLDYYPIEGQIILPGITIHFSEFNSATEQYAQITQKFQEFFKIPVDTSFVVQYDIDKRYEGSSYGAKMDSNYFINAEGAVTEDACYFTINSVKEDGTIVDTSLIPGGYGIYCLPYQADLGVDPDKLEMVYALDPAERFDSLSLSSDGKRLRLHTWKENDLMLTVIDIATMTQVQKVRIVTNSNKSYYNVVSYDDFVLITEDRLHSDSLDRIMVWEELEDGTYRQAISAPINAGVFPDGSYSAFYNEYNSAMDYADGKLAVLIHKLDAQGYSKRNCDFYIAVYDSTSMVYAASVELNLTGINNPDPYGERIEPMFSDSLEVSWS